MIENIFVVFLFYFFAFVLPFGCMVVGSKRNTSSIQRHRWSSERHRIQKGNNKICEDIPFSKQHIKMVIGCRFAAHDIFAESWRLASSVWCLILPIVLYACMCLWQSRFQCCRNEIGMAKCLATVRNGLFRLRSSSEVFTVWDLLLTEFGSIYSLRREKGATIKMMTGARSAQKLHYDPLFYRDIFNLNLTLASCLGIYVFGVSLYHGKKVFFFRLWSFYVVALRKFILTLEEKFIAQPILNILCLLESYWDE